MVAMLFVHKVVPFIVMGVQGNRVQVDLESDATAKANQLVDEQLDAYESLYSRDSLLSADLDEATALIKRAQSGVLEVVAQETSMLLFHLTNSTVSQDRFTGSCSQHDIAMLQAIGSHNNHQKHTGSCGERLNECGHSSFSMFSGFRKSKMAQCTREALSVSAPCADCFVEAGSYGYHHCKGACIWNWCSHQCLQCTRPSKPSLFACLVGSELGEGVPRAEEC